MKVYSVQDIFDETHYHIFDDRHDAELFLLNLTLHDYVEELESIKSNMDEEEEKHFLRIIAELKNMYLIYEDGVYMGSGQIFGNEFHC